MNDLLYLRVLGSTPEFLMNQQQSSGGRLKVKRLRNGTYYFISVIYKEK